MGSTGLALAYAISDTELELERRMWNAIGELKRRLLAEDPRLDEAHIKWGRLLRMVNYTLLAYPGFGVREANHLIVCADRRCAYDFARLFVFHELKLEDPLGVNSKGVERYDPEREELIAILRNRRRRMWYATDPLGIGARHNRMKRFAAFCANELPPEECGPVVEHMLVCADRSCWELYVALTCDSVYFLPRVLRNLRDQLMAL